MIRTKLAALAALTIAGLLAGCGEPAKTDSGPTAIATGDGETTAAAPAEPVAATTTPSPTSTAEAGWAGLHDAATQTKLKKRVKEFFEEYNAGPFGLMFVDSLSGKDHRLAAGKLAFKTGAPAIVISIDQKEIFFVGDESFTPEFSGPATKAMAAKFDKGDYEGGIEDGLTAIFVDWGFE